MENSLTISQKASIKLPYNPAIPLLSIYAKRIKKGTQANTCTHLFLAALFIISRDGNTQNIHHPLDGKTKCIYSHMENYSAIKRNKVQIHATMQMNCENIMLS